ncbi:MAG: phosphoribosylamine--glycine ligase [Bdellovibrionales bacterium]|nr:phosphoribosylamine--glycine ligase [Bdellovibrionales bacterium]
MNVLVIGSGGREHAMVLSLKNSLLADQIHAIPGRNTWKEDCISTSMDFKDFEKVTKYVQERNIGLVVIGPEEPLAVGLSDHLRSHGISVFGPGKEAAQLEASKLFAKQFMQKAGVPTARYTVVHSVEQTLSQCDAFQPPYVLKADGLAAGKGVFICQSKEELKLAAQKLFEEKVFGEAGRQALLEEFQRGWELSVFVLTNGEDYILLPFSQDHKRLENEDKGPNTGGMGVVAPIEINEELLSNIKTKVAEPSVKGLKDQGLYYRGVLYIGLMIEENNPSIIEYNVRFGDPEAQALLPLLNGDWCEVFDEIANGKIPELKWKKLYSNCVVIAAENYPESPVKGVEIHGEVYSSTPSSYFLQAGTFEVEGEKVTTHGGRVLNALGLGSSRKESIENSYFQARKVQWPGMQLRTDIGSKVK